MTANLPTEPPLSGTFTYVFTDIVGSTVMTRELEAAGQGNVYTDLRNRHRDRLLDLAHRNHALEAQRAGDGHFLVFASARDALKTVVAFQDEMRQHPIYTEVSGKRYEIFVRIGVHTCYGERVAAVEEMEGRKIYEFPGGDTNFAARVAAVAVGGQIITSDAFIDAAWQYGLANTFQHPEPEDRDAPQPEVPKIKLRCWPGRMVKSFDDPNKFFEILYDDIAAKSRNEPGSRFFPEFYTREANRYINRDTEQKAVYAALGFGSGPDHRTDSHIALVQAEGGMGKTRIAVTCAVRAAASFTDGVYFVSLAMAEADAAAGKGDAAFLAAQILASLSEARKKDWDLSQPEGQPQPSLEKVIAAIRDRNALFVLDNFESVDIDLQGEFLSALATARAHLLVTTRVQPPVGDLGNTVPLDDGMDEESAYDLACTRIRQRKGQVWQPSASERESLHDIITLTGIPSPTEPDKLLGAIPLALELAVGKYPGVSLWVIAQQLRESPLGEVLASSATLDDKSTYKRHHSVTHLLDWSYSLLPPELQSAFAACGLFTGSFCRAALESTAAITPFQVGVLVNNSLLRPAENDRYTLHNLTRAYAKKRFEGGKFAMHFNPRTGKPDLEARPPVSHAEDMRKRFVDWHATFLQQRENDRGKPDIDDPARRAEFAVEKQNLLAAARLYRPTDGEEYFYDFGNFGLFLQRIGDWTDQKALYGELQSLSEAFESQRPHAWLLHELANVLDNQGRWDEAIQAYEQSLIIERAIGDRQGEAASLHGKANVFDKQGRWDDAIQAYEQSLVIKRSIGNRQGEAASLHGKANVLDNQGRWDEAIEAYEQSYGIYHAIGDRLGEAASLASVASPLFRTGRLAAAIAHLRSATDTLLALGDFASAGICLGNRAFFLSEVGRLDEAIECAREAVAVYAKTQDENGKRKAAELLARLTQQI